MWQVTLVRRDELSPETLAEQRELGLRSWAASSEPDERYPFGITWAAPTWLALVRDETGRLVGRAGVLQRQIRWGNEEVPVGGVSSVSTDPDFQGRGIARAGVSRLMRFMSDELGAHAGLLIASEMGRPVYARLGWQVVGPLRCEQPDGSVDWNAAFPTKLAMAWPCDGHALPSGHIDLLGLPW
ncbi:MAG: GNAT family N-acetyltransferase [Chloroflexi bacterium]|nr:GNAT family N-acetyltransferase [Chloroflexota bacterium]